MGTARWTHVVVVTAVAVLLGGCGGDDDAPTATADSPTPEATAADPSPPATPDGSPEDEPTDEMDMGDMATGDFGEPADPAEADRVIDVKTDNDLAFKPDTFEVKQGETITFRISNTGDVEHEFVLGDEEAQEAMAEQMESGGDHAHGGEMSNAVTIHPGETAELTWRFTTPGRVLVGCHVPGHWEAGMRGSVVVS